MSFHHRRINLYIAEGEILKKFVMIVCLTVYSNASMAKTKVYGELHSSYDRVFAVGEKSRDDFNLNDFIVGVKSSTEIKKDTSFIYNFAWGFNSKGFDAVQDSGIQNKNQVIGIANPKGAVVLGRFDTPFKKVGEKADLFWNSQLGQNRNVTNAQTWDLRADKIIAFQTPIMNGFQGSFAYASDISDTSSITSNASAISLNGFYKKGKFIHSAAFEQHDLKNSTANTHAIRLSSTYRDGPYKIVGFLQQENNDFSNTNQADAIVFGVGLAYRKAKGLFKAQFYRRDEDKTNKNIDLIAIGYDYKLQRKLDVYAQAAYLTNAVNLGGEDFDGLANPVDMHGVSFGIRYKF